MTTNTEKIAALQGSMEDVERSQEEIEANLRDVRDQQEGLSNVLAELKGQHEDYQMQMRRPAQWPRKAERVDIVRQGRTQSQRRSKYGSELWY